MKSGRKINFSYKGEKNNVTLKVQNYQPTNLIIDKYIVQPQEMNIIINNSHDLVNKNKESVEKTER